jgi:hypothetical protein
MVVKVQLFNKNLIHNTTIYSTHTHTANYLQPKLRPILSSRDLLDNRDHPLYVVCVMYVCGCNNKSDLPGYQNLNYILKQERLTQKWLFNLITFPSRLSFSSAPITLFTFGRVGKDTQDKLSFA